MSGFLLEDLARSLALYKHKDQRYGKHPYSVHLQAVVDLCHTSESRIVAWLHDILEDTDILYETIEDLFGETIAEAVFFITKQVGYPYECYIKNIKTNRLALTVKIADTKCNLWQSERDGDQRRIDKYTKQLEMLLA